MGCRPTRHKQVEAFPLIPDSDSEASPSKKPAPSKAWAKDDDVNKPLLFEEPAEKEEEPAAKEEDLGNSDDDDWIDDDSSGSDPGLPPEARWAKQGRRQLRQVRRRQRALRRAKRDQEAIGYVPDGVTAECARHLDMCYNIGQRLGRGTYASVSLCIHLETKAEAALKTIDRKKSSGEEQIKEELEIMRIVNHPHVIKLHDIFEDARYAHVVMELLAGGELYELVAANPGKGFPETQCARAVRQIASAVAYLHSIRVVHRDLKPENVMLTKAGDDLVFGTLKVIDFSLSRRFEPGRFMQTLACTAHYVAPEILHRRYTESCDIWSFGVMVYVLMSGTQPFTGNSEAEIFESVKSGRYDFDERRWASKSAAPKDLIRKMLLLDPASRLTAEQVSLHAWLAMEKTCDPIDPDRLGTLS